MVPQGSLSNIKICHLGVQVNSQGTQKTTKDTKKEPNCIPQNLEVTTSTVLTRATTEVKNENGSED